MMKLVVVLLALRFSLISAQNDGVDLTLEPGAKGMDVVRAVITKIESSGIFDDPNIESSLADPFIRRMAYVESRDGEAENYPEGGIWALDEDKFTETRSYTLQSLLDKYEDIDACFGVDWTNLQYEELQKPFYSGLATRLKIYNLEKNEMAKVPVKSEQGNYWVRHFPKSGVNVTKWDEGVKELDRGGTEECSVNTDVAFVIDESGSVGAENYELVKSFVHAFIDSIKDSNDDKVALIIYSDAARLEFGFTDPINNNKSRLLDSILRLPYNGGYTNTPDGVCALLPLPWQSGIGAIRLAVVVTDGQTNRNSPVCGTLPQATAMLHSLDPPVEVFAIGIGSGINFNELEIIASDRSLISEVTGFDTGLTESQERRAYEICNTVVPDVPVEELMSGTAGKGETTRLSLTPDSPDEGITLRLCVMEGSMELFASTTTKNPNSAFYEYKAMVNKTEQTEVSCVTEYFETEVTPQPRAKRRAQPEAMTLYVTLLGLEDRNEFLFNSGRGEVVFDVDECNISEPCSKLADCKNTDGSFLCVCNSSYNLVNRTECEDIDECEEALEDDNRICMALSDCVNTMGSYRCKVRTNVLIVIIIGILAALVAPTCFVLLMIFLCCCKKKPKEKPEDTEAMIKYEKKKTLSKKRNLKEREDDIDSDEDDWNYTLTLSWPKDEEEKLEIENQLCTKQPSSDLERADDKTTGPDADCEKADINSKFPSKTYTNQTVNYKSIQPPSESCFITEANSRSVSVITPPSPVQSTREKLCENKCTGCNVRNSEPELSTFPVAVTSKSKAVLCSNTSYDDMDKTLESSCSKLDNNRTAYDEIDISYVDPVEILTVGSRGTLYSNHKHDLSISIPQDAISNNREKTVKIAVNISLSSALSLPPETRPISPIIGLCVVDEPDFKFLKPVEITLPHCLVITDENDIGQLGLRFVKAKHNQNYFSETDGEAHFDLQQSYGTIKIHHFCYFCVVANKTIDLSKVKYSVIKVVPRVIRSSMWSAIFCITYYLSTCLRAVEAQFSVDDVCITTLRKFRFPSTSTDEAISIKFDREVTGGWHLALETSDEIFASDVEFWDIDPEELELSQSPQQKQYPPRFIVTISGAESHRVGHAQICFNAASMHLVTELLLEPKHRRGSSIGSIGSGNSLPLTLDSEPSHVDLMNKVASQIPTKWRDIGIQLGLSIPDLDTIEQGNPRSSSECFSTMFHDWKRKVCSPYTWSTIIDALEAPAVGENRLARELAEFIDRSSSPSNSISEDGLSPSRGEGSPYRTGLGFLGNDTTEI